MGYTVDDIQCSYMRNGSLAGSFYRDHVVVL